MVTIALLAVERLSDSFRVHVVLAIVVVALPRSYGWAQVVDTTTSRDGQTLIAGTRIEAEAIANAHYALTVTPAKRVAAEFLFQVYAPKLRAKEWILYAADPPQLVQQRVRAHLHPGGQSVADLTEPSRSLLLARVPVKGSNLRKGITARLQIEAELRARRLVPRAQSDYQPPATLADDDRARLTMHDELMDFESSRYQQWLDVSRLRRVQSECQVDYARRVFQYIRNRFRYVYTSKMDRRASYVCASGSSDCGGLAIVFTAAMRAHGIPARVLVGRWAKSAKVGAIVGDVPFYQQHAKAEFYAEGVGWIPVDPASAVLHDRSRDGQKYFGDDKGDFITMHAGYDLGVDTFHFGEKTIKWLQGVTYWVSGGGSLDGVVKNIGWQVR